MDYSTKRGNLTIQEIVEERSRPLENEVVSCLIGAYEIFFTSKF